MRVLNALTWNVHEFHSAADGRKFDPEQCLRDAELVFLQEVPGDYDLRQLSYKYTASWPVEPSVNRSGALMGLAICSRFKIQSTRRILFPNPRWRSPLPEHASLFAHPKGALVAEIAHPTRTLQVACVHLLPPRIFELDEASNVALRYLSDIANHLMTKQGRLNIIAGDFNNGNRMLHFGGLGFASCTSGVATRPSGESHDDILSDGSLSLTDIKITPTPSDHFAVSTSVLL